MAIRPIPTEIAKKIGIRAQRLREGRGLTRPQVEETVHVKSMWSIETGRPASLETYRNLCITLGCSWNDLLGDPHDGADADTDQTWNSGYRAGVGDASLALRRLLEAPIDHHTDPEEGSL